MDLEEMVREENLERVGRRKKELDNTRMSRGTLHDVLEKAIALDINQEYDRADG